MSTQLIPRYCAWLVSILFVSSSFAQTADGLKDLPPKTITSTASRISEKLNRSFRQNFKDALNPRWFEIEQNFLVKFIIDDKENRALFTKNGILVYHISTGIERHLPSEVIKLVKSTYYDYSIKTIHSVFQNNSSCWVVSMEGDKNWVIVHVKNDEMTEVKKYKKT